MMSRVVRSVCPDEIIPENLSIPSFLRLNVPEESLDDVSQICADSGVEYTRNQVFDQASRFASALKTEFSLRPDDLVALLLPNVPEYLAISLGIMEAGLIPVNLNSAYTTYELKNMLAGIPIQGLVTLSSLLPRYEDLLTDLRIDAVVTLNNCSDTEWAVQGGGQSYDYFDLIRLYGPLETSIYCDGRKTAMIYFSSGTSGLPKGVKISHKNLIAELILLDRAITSGTYGLETMLCMFPKFHIGGSLFAAISLYQNWPIVSLEKFSTALYAQSIKLYKPTVLIGPAAMISIIGSSPDISADDLVQTGTVVYGGAPLSKVLAEKVKVKFSRNLVFHNAYGSTETFGFAVFPLFETAKIGESTVGAVLPNCELKVISPVTAEDLGSFQKGEICVRGPMVCNGYLNNEEATKKTFDSEGWYHTGDFGYYDDDGLLYIDGRIKDLIKVNGFQVSPEEIENLIRTHPKVKDVVVFGIPDEKYGEVPRALVVRADCSLTAQAVDDLLSDKLIAYKQLRGGIRFVESLPFNASGKLLRREARAYDSKFINEII